MSLTDLFWNLLRLLGSVAIVLSTLWAAAALWYHGPGGSSLRLALITFWSLAALAAVLMLWRATGWRALLAYALLFSSLLVWWGNVQPSQNRPWAEDVAQTLSGTVQGSVVELSHVRNFTWRSETDFTPRWETRRYDLDELVSVDLALSYWAGPAIAHTLVSFGFKDGRFLVFSVEIRKEQGESFSEIGGFFKQFELSLVAAEESDILRVRTNARSEDVYLYRLNMSPESMRSLFLAYIDEANALAKTPRFYNTLTTNCTTLVYQMLKRISSGLPIDYRLLLSGYLHEYAYAAGGLDSRFTLQALRDGGRITDRALKAAPEQAQGPQFSQAIRRGMPGVQP